MSASVGAGVFHLDPHVYRNRVVRLRIDHQLKARYERGAPMDDLRVMIHPADIASAVAHVETDFGGLRIDRTTSVEEGHPVVVGRAAGRVMGLAANEKRPGPQPEPPAPKCITLRVLFANQREREYPIHTGGDWSYQERPDRLVVRPNGASGNARHEVPLGNIQSIMVVGLNGGGRLND